MTTPDEERVQAIRERLAKAEATITVLNNGEGRWRMSIPARPDDDPDLIFAAVLRDASDLLRENDALRTKVAYHDARLEECRANAERYHEHRVGPQVRTHEEAYAALFSNDARTYDELMGALLIILTANGVAAWNGDGTSVIVQALEKLFNDRSTARASLPEDSANG
jgi:hypothetical protein